MKISMLVHDLSLHSIVRTYPIAKALQRRYQVEVLGPVFGSEIYKPYKDEFSYKSVNANSWLPLALPPLAKLAKKIEGDVIYAFKPMPASYGLGLTVKLSRKLPLVLDIEDLDGSFPHKSTAKRIAYPLLSNYSIKGYGYIKLMQRLTGFADQKTVVSDFLQKRFGGIKLPHGADCTFFNPKKTNRENIREVLGVQNKKVVLFSGTALPHKGIAELVKAMEALNRKDLQLLIAGKKSKYLDSLIKNKQCVRHLGVLPHSRMPELLSASDAIVLPQRNNKYAQAQVPGKVFEAMAMAKPVIATPVSDLPEILKGCGWIAGTEKPRQLAKTIEYVLDNPKEARRAGLKARKKCIENYSWNAMEKTLAGIFKKYE